MSPPEASLSVIDACCTQKSAAKLKNQIPEDIVENELLKKAIQYALPQNYEFEIEKILWRIRQLDAKHVGLQFPEGLLMFASQIGAILVEFSSHLIEVSVIGDVTYGACCIDDLTARSIGVDFLVHFGHSCLVPIEQTILKCLYIFVDIVFDFRPLVDSIKANFPIKPLDTSLTEFPINDDSSDITSCVRYAGSPTISILGTIQYSSVVHAAKDALRKHYGDSKILVPQEMPLTAGEVLGCTSPNLSLKGSTPDFVIFVSDGRFHLESAMIQNPSIPFFRYDPFTKKLLKEDYDHHLLHRNRLAAIDVARTAKRVGIILGTLGRQGSVGIFERIQGLLREKGVEVTLFLMSEIMPARLEQMSARIDAFVQVACPRLSLDWGHFFNNIPLLSPYESFVAFSDEKYKEVYPMDYYSNNGGAWTNYKQEHRSGSIAAPVNSFSQLEARRVLIRRRAEERKAKQLAANAS